MHIPPIGTHPFPIIFLTNLFKSFLFGAVSMVYSLHVSPMSFLINLNILSFRVKSGNIYSGVSLLTRKIMIANSPSRVLESCVAEEKVLEISEISCP